MWTGSRSRPARAARCRGTLRLRSRPLHLDRHSPTWCRAWGNRKHDPQQALLVGRGAVLGLHVVGELDPALEGAVVDLHLLVDWPPLPARGRRRLPRRGASGRRRSPGRCPGRRPEARRRPRTPRARRCGSSRPRAAGSGARRSAGRCQTSLKRSSSSLRSRSTSFLPVTENGTSGYLPGRLR